MGESVKIAVSPPFGPLDLLWRDQLPDLGLFVVAAMGQQVVLRAA